MKLMYSLADFAALDKKNKYVLPVEQKKILNYLCKHLGVEASFSILIQEKKTIQDSIREINKITNETKDVRIPIILDIVKSNETDLPPFADTIFSILCKNTFFAKTYAELFLKLQANWPIFQEILHQKHAMYIASFDTIEIGDPEQYDAYCEFKKKNDERRAFSFFLVQLVQCGTIQSLYVDTVDYIITRIESLLHVNQKETMNELVENLFLLKKEGFPKDRIEKLSKLKPSDCIGVNYKILFRFMDILQ